MVAANVSDRTTAYNVKVGMPRRFLGIQNPYTVDRTAHVRKPANQTRNGDFGRCVIFEARK